MPFDRHVPIAFFQLLLVDSGINLAGTISLDAASKYDDAHLQDIIKFGVFDHGVTSWWL